MNIYGQQTEIFMERQTKYLQIDRQKHLQTDRKIFTDRKLFLDRQT